MKNWLHEDKIETFKCDCGSHVGIRRYKLEIKCPKCEKMCKDLGEILPRHSCDDTEIECGNCSHEFKIGWVAEVEYR